MPNWAWLIIGVAGGLMAAAVAAWAYVMWLAYELWRRS